MKSLTILVLIPILFASFQLRAQNIGINSTGASTVTSAALDIDMSDKGLLIPRVALTSTTVFAPVTGTPTTSLLIYNTATAGTTPTNVVPGFYYWNNTSSKWTALSAESIDWKIAGNSGTLNGTNFIGTTDNQAFDIRTNNIIRARVTVGGQIEILNNGESVLIGQNAGIADDLTANKNVAIGANALQMNVSGEENVAVGNSALRNTVGSSNTAVGYQSMYANTSGYNNVALGENSLYGSSTSYNNVALGGQALGNTTTGIDNTAIGIDACFTNSTSSSNLAIGNRALFSSTASQNMAVGYRSMQQNTTGTLNTALGGNTLLNNTIGSNNTALGYQTMYSNTTSSENLGVGYKSMFSNTTGTRNTGIGFSSLYTNSLGTNNTALGYNTLKFSTGNQNTALGSSALAALTSGSSNSAFGYEALLNNTTAINNQAFGYQALRLNTTGSDNTAIGFRSLRSSTSGSGNVAVGHLTLTLLTTGNQNTVLGINAGNLITTADKNVIIGAYSGNLNVTGANNLYLGCNSGSNSTGSNNVFIGFRAGENELGNDKLYIENSNISTPLVYGDFSTNTLQINGTLNINNVYSLPTIDGTANYLLKTNGSGVISWVNPTALGATESDPQVSSSTTNTIPIWNGVAIADGTIFDNGTNIGIGTTAPTSNFQTSGSVGSKVDFYSTSVTLNNEHCVFFNGNAGEMFTFPAATSCKGRVYIIVNHGTGSLDTSSYLTGNATSNNIILADETVRVISDGTNWRKF